MEFKLFELYKSNAEKLSYLKLLYSSNVSTEDLKDSLLVIKGSINNGDMFADFCDSVYDTLCLQVQESTGLNEKIKHEDAIGRHEDATKAVINLEKIDVSPLILNTLTS